MEQGNQLLQNGADANDAIRDRNAVNFDNYQKNLKQDKEMLQGEEWYHGVTDAIGAHGFLQTAYNTSQRMKNLGVGFGGLMKADALNAGNRALQIGSEAGGLVIGGVKSVTGAVDSVISAPTALAKAFTSKVPAVAETVAGGGIQSSADIANLTSKGSTLAETAGNAGTQLAKTTQSVGNAISNAGGEATSLLTKTGEATGSLGERAIQFLTGGRAEVGTIANAGLGKVVGNIGGGIDIVKDFENIGKQGGFFGGTGTSTGDEISNALTVGGTILDVASLALPFLAPIAGAVQIAGAIDGTVQAVKDGEQQQQTDKGNYDKATIQTQVPPSLAGVGFLASQASDPRKLIGGGGNAF